MSRSRFSARVWCGLGALAGGGASLGANSPAPLRVEVGVDPRVELVAVVCRLAGYEEFEQAGIAGYDTAVESHFRSFARHPAVELARTLRSSIGLAYNAPIEAALIAMPDTWAPRVALDP